MLQCIQKAHKNMVSKDTQQLNISSQEKESVMEVQLILMEAEIKLPFLNG